MGKVSEGCMETGCLTWGHCFCPPFCFSSLIEAWNVRMEKDLGIQVFQWPHFTEEQLGD